MRARQGLVEVMMRVDEPRQDDMARGVERRIGRNRGRLTASDAFDDLCAFDHDSALGIGCEDGERVLDPYAHVRAGSVFSKGRQGTGRIGEASQKVKPFWRASCISQSLRMTR